MQLLSPQDYQILKQIKDTLVSKNLAEDDFYLELFLLEQLSSTDPEKFKQVLFKGIKLSPSDFNDPSIQNLVSSLEKFKSVVQKLLSTLKTATTWYVGTSDRAPLIKSIKGFKPLKQDLSYFDIDHHGFTFFTRPKLNLLSYNLRKHDFFALFDTTEPTDLKFAIRCWLDTHFCYNKKISELVAKSPFINLENPFIPVLTNRLKSMSGWPDIVLETETTEGGYFNEDITYPLGWDECNRSYDLSATFADLIGGIILCIFMVWVMWIHYARRGLFVPYPKYIEERKMCFDIAIYRFLMDPSLTYITKWAKATGCYPVSVPIGAYFNFDSSQPFVLVSHDMSINFKVAGKIEYNRPILLKEFNMLVEKYCPGIKTYIPVRNKEILPIVSDYAIPYIDLEEGTLELQWRVPLDIYNNVVKQLEG